MDEAEFQRAVLDGQIVENVKWLEVMDGYAEQDRATILTHNTGMDEARKEIKERIEGLEGAGYLPKIKPLLYYLDFLVMELDRIKTKIAVEQDPASVEKLTIIQYKAEAKIEMTIDWLRAQDKAGDWGSVVLGMKGHEITLPKFGSKAEVDEAIKKRHMPRHGESVEDLIEGRVKRYRDDSKRITDGIDGQHKMDKETSDANQS